MRGSTCTQYREHEPEKLCQMLDGMFSFVLLDTSVTPSRMIAARDPIGITTLYQGWKTSDPSTVYFASELKALHDECDKVISFPPGHYYDSTTGKTERYFKPTWLNGDSGKSEDCPTTPADLKVLRESLEKAVKKRLMSEVPYGVLLSGGLDSSLIAAIAARETEKVVIAQERGRSRARDAKAHKAEGVNGKTNGAQDGLTGMIEGDVAEGGCLPLPSQLLLHQADNQNYLPYTEPMEQRSSRLSQHGHGCTRSASVCPGRLISSLPGKQQSTSRRSTTSTPSRSRKVSTPSTTSFTTLRRTT